MGRIFDDAIPDYLEADGTPPVVAAPFTFVTWGQSDDVDDLGAVMSVGDKDVADQHWILSFDGITGGDPVKFNATSGTEANLFTTTGFTINTWHHAAAVEASATDHRVLIDGGSKATSATNKAPSGADRVSIGRRASSGGAQESSGKISHAAIYDVALSDADVASLAAGVNPKRYRPGNLVALWPINGSSPEKDIVGGFNLTVTGSTVDDEAIPQMRGQMMAPA
jgi:hypothetical protein